MTFESISPALKPPPIEYSSSLAHAECCSVVQPLVQAHAGPLRAADNARVGLGPACEQAALSIGLGERETQFGSSQSRWDMTHVLDG